MNCEWCDKPAVFNNTSPESDDGYWCEDCQFMTYPEENDEIRAFAAAKEREMQILMGSTDENDREWDYLQGAYEAYGVIASYARERKKD